MRFDNAFDVQAPIGEVWTAMLDVERVAPCVPGAEVLGQVSDDSYKVGIKIRIGPIVQQYRGEIEIVESDESAHRAVMKARAREMRGQGRAEARMELRLTDEGDRTRGDMATEVSLSGPAAAMGRGIIQDVSSRIVEDFAKNLAAMLASGPATPTAEAPEATVPEAATPDEPATPIPGTAAPDEPAVPISDTAAPDEPAAPIPDTAAPDAPTREFPTFRDFAPTAPEEPTAPAAVPPTAEEPAPEPPAAEPPTPAPPAAEEPTVEPAPTGASAPLVGPDTTPPPQSGVTAAPPAGIAEEAALGGPREEPAAPPPPAPPPPRTAPPPLPEPPPSEAEAALPVLAVLGDMALKRLREPKVIAAIAAVAAVGLLARRRRRRR